MVYYLVGNENRCCIPFFSTDFSRDKRIVFAVTRYDQYYSGNKGEEVEMKTIQESVRRHLKEIEIDVSLEQIVPVSGLWALTARQLVRTTNPERSVSRRARRFLETLMDFKAGGESCCDDDLNDSAVAMELEKASNIAELETRLVDLLCIMESMVMGKFCRWLDLSVR